MDELVARLSKLETRVSSLEGGKPAAKTGKASPAPAKSNGKAAKDDDSDIDLFGSDDDVEANKVREQRLADYAAKKAKSKFLNRHDKQYVSKQRDSFVSLWVQ